MAQSFYISIYLVAIVSANLLVSAFGQPALIVTAFILIPFDLVTRDILHEEWDGRGIQYKMPALILSGSLLTYMMNVDAGRIAVASVAAFGSAGVVNWIVYEVLRKRSRMIKMNASNALAAITDSVMFPIIAFEVVSAGLCVSQASMKMVGGFFWSYLFTRLFLKAAAK